VDSVRPIDILLVEDHVPDQRLTKRAFSKSKLKNNLHIANDGVEAMSFLRKEEPFENAPTPNLILLDLNMPRMDGRDVLRFLKNDDSLKHIPVVILTTSSDEKDVFEAYGLHANAYITKPVSFSKFMKAIQSIEDHWFVVVTVPTVK
jgi:chemotaxis family two-component system response regulator Rcp1